VFALNSDLAEHWQEHLKEFQCDICHFSLTNKEDLIKHVSVRHQFKCEICSTSFKKNSDLNHHKKKSHPLPFECICSMDVIQMDSNGRFPYIRCKAAFATSEELIQHVWQKHKFKYVLFGVSWSVLGVILGIVLGRRVLGGIPGVIFGAFWGFNFRYTVKSKRTHENWEFVTP
jgi:uncharacterized C2H2 Zn-finger protein